MRKKKSKRAVVRKKDHQIIKDCTGSTRGRKHSQQQECKWRLRGREPWLRWPPRGNYILFTSHWQKLPWAWWARSGPDTGTAIDVHRWAFPPESSQQGCRGKTNTHKTINPNHCTNYLGTEVQRCEREIWERLMEERSQAKPWKVVRILTGCWEWKKEYHGGQTQAWYVFCRTERACWIVGGTTTEHVHIGAELQRALKEQEDLDLMW